MKFYFCETCGKRLTEDDISAGSAMNKKLKGVFCRDCAIGVSTMDTLPMSDDEARRTLSEVAGQDLETKPPEDHANRRKSDRFGSKRIRRSSTRLAVAKTSLEDIDKPSLAGTDQTMRNVFIVGGAAGLVFAVMATAWLATPSEPTQPGFQPDAPQADAPTTNVSATEEPAPVATPKSVKTPNVKATPPVDAETRARQAYEELERFEGVAPDDLEERRKRIYAFLKAHKGTRAAEDARQLRLRLRKEHATAARKAGLKESEPGNAGSPTAKTKDADQRLPTKAGRIVRTETPAPDKASSQEDVTALRNLLQTVIAALRDGDLELARASVTGNKTVSPTRREGLARIIRIMETERGSLVESLKKLIGEKVRLSTHKAVVSGRLKEVTATELLIARVYVINREEKEAGTVRVKLKDLTVACRARLHIPSPTKSPDDWVARALSKVAEGDDEGALKSLSSCGGHTIEGPLRKLLEGARATRLETEAMSKWVGIEERASKRISLATAKSLLKELDHYEKEYASTDFARGSERPKERESLRERLQRMTLGMDRRVSKLFHGHIKSYDPRTQTITVQYDFSNRLHWKDFDFEPSNEKSDKSGVYIAPKGLTFFHKFPWMAFLHFPQFRSGNVKVTARYNGYHKHLSNRMVNAAFFTEGSKGKSRKISVVLGFKDAIKFTAHTRYHGHMGETLKQFPYTAKFPESGTLEYSCKQGKLYRVKHNGTTLLAYASEEINDHRGIALGGGWNTRYTLTHVQVEGQLHPDWLAKALARQK